MPPSSHCRICVVGSANVDLTFRTPRLPQPGETLPAQGFHLGFGGKGANQAVAAARLGASVCLVAAVGTDSFGQDTLKQYGAEGLDTTHVHLRPDCPTGLAAIVVDEAARNCILIVPGANATLAPQDVQQAAQAIRQASVLLCQLEVPWITTLEALRLGRAAGVRSILTPAPAQELASELLQLCDLCLPNEREIEQLTGLQVRTLEEVATAAQKLRQRGPATVIVTLGERGALLVDQEGSLHLPTVPVKAVDTTGAGDAFSATVAVFWAEGLPLRAAAHRAARVASLTVTRPGAQAAFPTRAEVDAFLAQKHSR